MGSEDLDGALLRASAEFVPAVPAAAGHVAIRTDSGTVDVELGSR